ncbi:MAG TPA: hypothetical protein VGB28_08395 [Actinomycetota bacterium]|jgi:chromosome segregation ATPase
MNEQSLNESNGILEAAASRARVGEIIPVTPAELADMAGVSNRLSAARAFRALMARGRIVREGEDYRLADAKPVEPGERGTVKRPARRRAAKTEEEGLPTYEQVGRVVIDRLIQLSAETAELRVALERSRGEAEAARREALEVTRTSATDRRRAQALEDEVSALKRRLEMTESNLRSLVQAATDRPAAPLDDSDARAILDILSSTKPGE